VTVLCFFVVAPLAAQDGAAIYKTKCAMCHGADGNPSPAMAKSMGLKSLGSPEVQKLSDAEMKDVVDKGKGKMKPIKLSPAERDAVVKQVRSFKK
jgi:mono/diheme cytochrome c family protein